jgi:membrane protease YdiL (CAAX protease family)
LIALLIAAVITIVLVTLIGAFYIAAGFKDPEDASSFEFVAIAAQSLALVGVTIVATSKDGVRPRPQDFGFRRTNPSSAFGWAGLAFFGYFALAALYTLIVQPAKDDLPQQLGADKSTTLAIITAIFVVVVAPFVEEFFFRGFLYQSLRNRLGVGGGAVASGLIFGAIHFKLQFLVPLAVLGMILALLFQRTNSLWPCIALHALNNALALLVLI